VTLEMVERRREATGEDCREDETRAMGMGELDYVGNNGGCRN